jgi:hypothetical protein
LYLHHLGLQKQECLHHMRAILLPLPTPTNSVVRKIVTAQFIRNLIKAPPTSVSSFCIIVSPYLLILTPFLSLLLDNLIGNKVDQTPHLQQTFPTAETINN